MATAGIGLYLEVERYDNMCKIIEEKFSHFHTVLDTHKNDLLHRVNEMKKLFLRHTDLDKAITQLQSIKNAAEETLTASLIAEDRGDVVDILNDKITKAQQDKVNLESFFDLEFLPNSVEVLNSFTKIHLRCRTNDFNQRIEPIVMNGKRGVGEGLIANPRGVAVDTERNVIYIVDYITRLVSMYSLEGEYLSNFGKGKLRDPHGICLSKDYLFVSNRGDSSISKFLKSGHFISDSRLANPGLQLGLLSGLCAHNDSIYVCNRGKHRIEVLNSDLKFVQSFAQGIFHCPEDVKVNNNIIFVMTQLERIIHAFSADFNLVSSIKLTGRNMDNHNLSFFTIDSNYNFVISNLHAGRLDVFSQSGQHIASLGDAYLRLPGGVSVDGSDRIVTVSQSDLNSIQIY